MARRLPAFLESIKFAHSVFALPFALIAMLLAAGGWPGAWKFFWIVIACVAARTAAMSFNRIADLSFDTRNPRTASRALVTGELSVPFMTGALAVSAGVFVFSALMLNRLCFLLSVPVLAILLGYSYTKRFTAASHFFLGLSLGLAPMGAWVALRETFDITPFLLSLAVVLWVSGFDILYSCQDFDVDSNDEDLHSIPKKLGIPRAMDFARKVHIAALVFFFLFWCSSSLGIISLLGVVAVGVLLMHQHRLVSPTNLSRLNAAFFTTNGIISAGFLVLVVLDIWA